MSETFTKIGGYIASGDALVYGDANTISGSGTVADPFGVKTQQLFVQAPLFTGTSGEGSATSGYIGFSGYNETVLYSSTQNAKTTAFTLSEPLTAFEKVRFEITGYTHVYAEDTHQTPSANNEEITICFTYYCKNSDANPCQMTMGTYSSTNGLNYDLVRSKFLYMPNTATVWAGNTTDGPHLQKIIGINRKQ